MSETHTVLGWRVWTDDGGVYDSLDTAWAAVPDDGVLFVMIYFADGTKRAMSGHDYYFMATHPDGPIYGSDMQPPDPARYQHVLMKRGRWAPDPTMKRVQHAAFDSTWSV